MNEKIELYNKIMDLGKQVADLQADFMILCLKYQDKYGLKALKKLMEDFERSK